jgi:hypothetical protein
LFTYLFTSFSISSLSNGFSTVLPLLMLDFTGCGSSFKLWRKVLDLQHKKYVFVPSVETEIWVLKCVEKRQVLVRFQFFIIIVGVQIRVDEAISSCCFFLLNVRFLSNRIILRSEINSKSCKSV